jgi:hypothetical protein
MSQFKLRDYQEDIARRGLNILAARKILILNMEVRTGKTHTSLDIASNYKNVLFVTKKKAISSIEDDYKTAGHTFPFTIINYESLHKVTGKFDLVIADESHVLSAYPKPSNRTRALKILVTGHLILMTGTLIPESNSQIYHQLWISPHSPFRWFKNFYAWFREYGTPEVVYTSYGPSKSYKVSNWDNIHKKIKHLMITYTQKESGFKSSVNETIIHVDTTTGSIIRRLKRDRVVEGKNEVILADTAVKLMQKVHQLSSGTIKFESGNKQVLDYSKVNYIRDNFKGKKLAIFYKFTAEFEAIKSVLDVTQSVEEFNESDKHIALQIISGREGINLSKADCLIMYNIDFSAVSYWQARDRMTTKDREVNDIYWLFSKGGIEDNIYKAVSNKKDFTLKLFNK